MISLVDNDVFFAGRMAPKSLLNPFHASLSGPDRHRSAAGSVANDDNMVVDLDSRRLVNKDRTFRCLHTPRLHCGSSRAAKHELKSMVVKPSLTVELRPIRRTGLKLTAKLLQQTPSDQPPSCNSKARASYAVPLTATPGARQGGPIIAPRGPPAFFDHEFPHHS